MYHQAPDMDNDFFRAWTLIHELSEQLAHNQKMISTLASQAGLLQVRAFQKSEGRLRCRVFYLYPLLCRLRLGSLRPLVSSCIDSIRTFPKVHAVLPTHDRPPRAIRGILTRLLNRKVRIGAGTYQCGDGHRESCPSSGKQAAESAAKRV